MPFLRKVAGAWKPIQPYRRIAGVWKPVQLWRKIAGVWKLISSTYIATASPPASNVDVFGNRGNHNTNAHTVTTNVGTVGQYTYAWEYVSGVAMTVNNVNSSSTFWVFNITGPGVFTAVWRCKVTLIATGEVVYTNTVAISVTAT